MTPVAEAEVAPDVTPVAISDTTPAGMPPLSEVELNFEHATEPSLAIERSLSEGGAAGGVGAAAAASPNISDPLALQSRSVSCSDIDMQKPNKPTVSTA